MKPSSLVHEIFELYINLVSSGVLTQRLFELNTGESDLASPERYQGN